MKLKTDFHLGLQTIFGQIAIFFIAPLTYMILKALGYRIKNLDRLREEVKNAVEGHNGGWIICANHLTMIDSVFLAYAMKPLYRYVTHFREMPWNLPERSNFQKNIFLSLLCYLTKCIPISRGGDRSKMKETMEKCVRLLDKGEALLIFPEGGRTRTGRVNTDSFSYGVGRLAQKSKNCRILCIYLRGRSQEFYSSIPRIGETFSGKAEPFFHECSGGGLKAQRELARQIIDTLSSMEEKWFAEEHQVFKKTAKMTVEQNLPAQYRAKRANN
ncbi:MAG: 1-acyl-sn-glycerol-3-phosphate acyltransferase [Syntrophales bacterium]|jgi:1-acyl-sn-glycerol-3-phosphate acyltransferase|nr:1-acyl-sn-glycerol-3-phosphate acyltransferase [Syntrophales bacterium]MDY0045505.1 lysophospholipid acyltransferase family protein [Syntrophales bacterium]